MKFNDFDKLMRVYEENIDQYILNDMYIVARLDGRSFTKMTKKLNFEKPFDVLFRELMVETTKYLVKSSGFRIIYGYTQSDEISLLFSKNDNTFNRKVRKINSTLAGEASAYFTFSLNKYMLENSHDLGENLISTFDCRVIPLPNIDRVVDYFLWRQEDANRNSLNGWCYWTLKKDGLSKRQATAQLMNKGNDYKNELLFKHGINYNDLPKWQKRGTGVTINEYDKNGINPITGEVVKTTRRDLCIDYFLGIHKEYEEYIRNIIDIDNRR